jgi:hypothetical protein
MYTKYDILLKLSFISLVFQIHSLGLL